jgi:hypothetical protein
MADSNNFGPCRLCSNVGKLMKSHYVPAGIYRIMKYKNLQPLLSSPDTVISASKQLRVPLLCNDCEQRFDRLGEKWVQARMARDFENFPLGDLLREKTTPVVIRPGSFIYPTVEVPEIDAAKITYFALSIFWRGAVHDWQGLNGPLPRVPLGDFEIPIQQFLLGRAPFPQDVVLNVLIWPRRPVLLASYAPVDSSTQKYGNFHFYIPGMHFELFTGREIPPWVRSMCFVASPSHPIASSERYSDEFLRHLQRQLLPKQREKA